MPFKPGESGNPSGRPAVSEAFKRKAREEAYRALEVLIAAMDDEDVKVRIQAAGMVIDRGFGKPIQDLTLANAEGEEFRVAAVDRRILESDPNDRNPTRL
jgi:hypothetical protein